MVRYENHCCHCAVPGYPCRGSACPNINVPVHYCDNPKCGAELPDDGIYEVDDEELCEDCLKERFLKR
jgi:hypothetical protein